MKISDVESGKALAAGASSAASTKILPADRPKGSVSAKKKLAEYLSPLEQGMMVAEAALADVPDVREQQVQEIKKRIQSGDYKVDGREVADMMLRRLAADRIR